MASRDRYALRSQILLRADDETVTGAWTFNNDVAITGDLTVTGTHTINDAAYAALALNGTTGGGDLQFRTNGDARAAMYNDSTDGWVAYSKDIMQFGTIAAVNVVFFQNSVDRLKVTNTNLEYYNASASLQLTTQVHSTNYATSALQIKDHAGTLYDVGFNVQPPVTSDTTRTVDEIDVGKMLYRSTTAATAFTLPSGVSGAVPPVGSVIDFCNDNATGAMTILASGTLKWFTGAGTPATGTRTLAEGGICRCYHYSNTVWWIWALTPAGLT